MYPKIGGKLMQNKKIQAVSENELCKYLSSLEELEAIEAGTIRCEYCGKIITTKNLHAIIPQEERISYCCDASMCIAKMTWGS